MRIWSYYVWTACCLGIVGCQEPPDLVSVTPPGSVEDRTPKEAEGHEPQALGEQRRTTTAATKAETSAAAKQVEPAAPTAVGSWKTTATGLMYQTLAPGSGPEVKAGQTVTVRYKGTLENGTTFDQSEGVAFLIGRRRVIEGWDQGVVGMMIGERRKLIIPPALGYGDEGQPPKIPPRSTLVFEIEVLKAK